MTKIFLDTEFLDDGRRIEPVSLALVSQAAAEYYAICSDCDMAGVIRNDWLRANVVPHLPVTTTAAGWRWDTTHPDYPRVKPRAQIAAEVRAFLARQPEPEIWAYYSPYDAVVLCQLYGPMSDLPPDIPAFTRDLMQEADRHGTVLPAQHPPVHHALSDARHDLRIATAIGLIGRNT
jgi:hypothetical protein